MSKSDLGTVLWYRLVKKAVNERADIKETIQALLLKALGASASASPWHAVLSKGAFSIEVLRLVHGRKHGTVGLGMYQLALVPAVPAGESMSAELAETMEAVKANMTAGGKAEDGPRYFTIAMKRAVEADRREEGEAVESDRRGR